MQFGKLVMLVIMKFVGLMHGAIGDNLLMIINYNFAHYDSVPFLQQLYKPYFPHTVFCGPADGPLVKGLDIHKGYFGYKSIAYAMEHFPEYKGYLYTNDDCIVNCWNLERFNTDTIWFTPPVSFILSPDLKKSNWSWWKSEWGYDALVKAYENLPEKYKTRLKQYGDDTIFGFTYSDIVYFPAKYRDEVIELCNHFAAHNVFLEIAVPMICACISNPNSWEEFKGLNLWGYDREKILAAYGKQLDYIHPIKLSNTQLQSFIKVQFDAVKK